MGEVKLNYTFRVDGTVIGSSQIVGDQELIEKLYKIDDLEIEMNREWLYDEDDNNIGETNFIVTKKVAEDFYLENYKDKYEDFKDFLACYIPEEEGQELYSYALSSGNLIDDLGKVYYNE